MFGFELPQEVQAYVVLATLGVMFALFVSE